MSGKDHIEPVPAGLNDEDEKVIQPIHQEKLTEDVEAHKPRYAANSQLDDAAKLLEEAGGHIEYTKKEEKRVLRMVDFYCCLPMCLVYFIQCVLKHLAV